jgi:hypothetical protein
VGVFLRSLRLLRQLRAPIVPASVMPQTCHSSVQCPFGSTCNIVSNETLHYCLCETDFYGYENDCSTSTW